MSIDDEGKADEVAIPTGGLKPVRALTQVRTHDDDLAVMKASLPAAGVPSEQHTVLPHDAERSLLVDRRLTCLAQFSIGRGRNAAIT
jgi:hypothetical protein